MTSDMGNQQPLVMSLHGIRTRGEWQKSLTRSLGRAKLTHDPLDFGFFRALSLLIPSSRLKRVDWFLEKYTEGTEGLDQAPSIIAHSFGTYIVARAIEKYDLKFDTVIFCGSIVRTDFPWKQYLDSGQIGRVLNEHGRLDFWAKVVGYFVEDAGPSGVVGFLNNDGKPYIEPGKMWQRLHPEFRHSDYFYALNYRNNWVPFLVGADPPAGKETRQRKTNWNFRIALAVASLAAIAGSILAYTKLPLATTSTSQEADVAQGDAASTPASDVALPLPVEPLATRIIVRSDADCDLDIDGQFKQSLLAGDSIGLDLDVGTYVLECKSTKFPGIMDGKTVTLAYGEKPITLISIADKIGDHEQSLIAERQRREDSARARQEAENQVLEANLMLKTINTTTLLDTSTGLQWTKRASETPLTYFQAIEWCASKARGWRLPTEAELKQIHEPALPKVPGATFLSFKPKVSPLFELQSSSVWSESSIFSLYSGSGTGISKLTGLVPENLVAKRECEREASRPSARRRDCGNPTLPQRALCVRKP